jgi:hypothetical protein
MDHRSIARAKTTIAAFAAAPAEKFRTRRAAVAALVRLARNENDLVSAWLYVLSYAFLLRVPSEAVGIMLGYNGELHDGQLPGGQHSRLNMIGDSLCLQLYRRKHKPHGSKMRRSCWCAECRDTCPVHALANMFSVTEATARPFMLRAGSINAVLRRRLAIMDTPQAASYDTRCFRRGHAEDIAHSDSGLREILAAGEWSSKRFREYLDVERLEDAAVVAAHVPGELSSDSE